MLLKLADIRQQEDYDCGSAALDTVCRYWGVRERGPVALANPVQGMHPDTMEAVLRALGFRALSGEMLVCDLDYLTGRGPVLCPITRPAGGHWVSVRGVSRGRVYYQCPTWGPSRLSVEEWAEGWHDSTRAGHEFPRWGIFAFRESR